jgi:hypothetical protein
LAVVTTDSPPPEAFAYPLRDWHTSFDHVSTSPTAVEAETCPRRAAARLAGLVDRIDLYSLQFGEAAARRLNLDRHPRVTGPTSSLKRERN